MVWPTVEQFIALNIDAPEEVIDVVEDIFDSNEMALWLGPYQLMQSGKPLKFDIDAASNYIKKRKTLS